MKLPSVVAGQFYPDSPRELEKLFKSFETLPLPLLAGVPRGLLLPHAGYVYSGALAALGYRALAGEAQTLVVVGPSHWVRFPGLSIFEGEAAQTPLGDLPVDREACRFLLDQSPAFSRFEPAFAREHSVEAHFPLIKRYCPGAKVVPIIAGQGLQATVEPLVSALRALGRQKRLLLVASSDLSHYPDYGTAVEADRRFLRAVLTGEEKAIRAADRKILAEKHPELLCTHCGPEPLLGLARWAAAEKALKTQLLSYRNSGDVTGDRRRVVGYGAVAFCA
ncbi:MAG TPA: AmmeMemoRadiSam system protein B [bacterium]|nr:AmmeMemoRadiSam system protein B [bacterium]